MKFYKIGYWILLISFVVTLNFLRTNIVSNDNEIESINNLYKKRINSLLISNTSFQRRLNDFKCRNIITGETRQNIFQNNSLIILLGKFKCSKCQENELKRLDSLKLIFEAQSLDVFGITSKSQKDVVIRQKKILKITYPIYWVEDSVFYNLNIIQRFPQLLHVSDNIILSTFFPIVKDDEFSKLYYTDFISRMELQ